MGARMVIGITDCRTFSNYGNWILQEADVDVVRLGYQRNNLAEADRCTGVVLSGGDEDIHPSFYHKPEYLPFCHETDERRDEFEWKLLERLDANRQPLLGICRGLQLVNVFFGGSLIPDIPSFGKYNHSKFAERDRYHTLSIDNDSLLYKITNSVEGKINSAHHQSAGMIGRGLVANCFSPDGVVEGVERIRTDDNQFLMLVQWHPERMTDLTSPFSKNIKLAFLEACQKRSEYI